jgi:aryl-alcohol dehydrogenase-like predicted oxidoreductase
VNAPLRVVFGTATATDDRLTAGLLDQFSDAGGRAIDLANAYADGASERAVGAWLRARRRRDDMLLFAKGCHPPRCDPALVASEVETALRNLGTDSLDPFILHRDDPTIAIDTWAEVLAAELQRGTVRSVGVSNWTIERFRKLQNRLSGAGSVTVFSNHFSLAEMAEAPWPGCLAIDADGTRALARSGVTVVAWVSLAHGYLGNGSSADRSVWRGWATPANDAR